MAFRVKRPVSIDGIPRKIGDTVDVADESNLDKYQLQSLVRIAPEQPPFKAVSSFPEAQ